MIISLAFQVTYRFDHRMFARDFPLSEWIGMHGGASKSAQVVFVPDENTFKIQYRFLAPWIPGISRAPVVFHFAQAAGVRILPRCQIRSH